MNKLNTATIAGRIKKRTHNNSRYGRVGGTEHNKIVILWNISHLT
tara:strand:- start:435 stop:569 length:135 start_codon:yes stop_codon:yes gene_type:complete